MKVGDLLEQRRPQWRELEQLCARLQGRQRSSLEARDITRFAALYRAACADLALADARQLPPQAVEYLHRLVGEAHNQLYRARPLMPRTWLRLLVRDAPRRIFSEPCVQFVFVLFWTVFLLSAWLAQSPTTWPDFAEQLLSAPVIEELEHNFGSELSGRNPDVNFRMAGYYIHHNTSIGLKCFAGGLLVIPGVLLTVFNAAFLGATFGYMARPEVAAGQHFFEFVTAHGPCELAAIILAAGAGLRLGWAWIATNGLRRTDSLRLAGRNTLPVMGAAMVLFFLAALLEAFLSPSAAPYAVKAGVAVLCSALLMLYFVGLGIPRRPSHAA